MKLAIIDIETTGFVREKNNSIVELAIVLCDTETRKTEILFNNIVRESTLSEYHKRSWIFDHSDLKFRDVECAQDINTYRAEIQAILNKYKVTAYNKRFDMGWLASLGFKFKENLLVTHPIEIEINIPNVVQTKKKGINKKNDKETI